MRNPGTCGGMPANEETHGLHFREPQHLRQLSARQGLHLRTDAIALDRMAGDANAFIIPFWKLKPLAIRGPHGKEAGFLAPGLAEASRPPVRRASSSASTGSSGPS